MLILAFGITLNTMTGLGVSPIVSVAFSFAKVAGTTLGNATIVQYLIFITAQLILRHRREWIATLLQLPVTLLFSRLLDVFGAVLSYDSAAHSGLANGLLLIAAVFFTGLGACITVNMNLVPNPSDGIVQAISRKIGKELGLTKNLFDIGCVIASCTIGIVFIGKPVGIGIGTLVAMLGVGRVMALINRFARKPMCRAAGIE